MMQEQQTVYILRNALSEEACLLLSTEMKIHRSCQSLTSEEDVMSGDGQVNNSFSKYASLGNEAILLLMNQKANEIFGEELEPTYSYSRIMTAGATMPRHVDRPECSHSVTICLQKDKHNTPYPIYMGGEQVELEVGDAVFYRGCEVEHWRNAYEGEEHIQVFLHYTPKGSGLIYDGRPFVNFSKD